MCVVSLIVAGTFSVLLAIFGGYLGFGWGGRLHLAPIALFLGVCLPSLLAFPLFVTAVGVTKRALPAIWILAPIPWITTIASAMSYSHGISWELLLLPIFALFMVPANLFLIIHAVLVQFGTQFYELTHDSKWVRWKKPNHEPAA